MARICDVAVCCTCKELNTHARNRTTGSHRLCYYLNSCTDVTFPCLWLNWLGQNKMLETSLWLAPNSQIQTLLLCLAVYYVPRNNENDYAGRDTQIYRVRVSHQLRWLRATGSLTPHLDTLNAEALLGSVSPSWSPYTSGVPKLALSGRAFISPGFVANLIPKIEVSHRVRSLCQSS